MMLMVQERHFRQAVHVVQQLLDGAVQFKQHGLAQGNVRQLPDQGHVQCR
jgi:hypothetical protein